jgi:phosphatidylinositol alpha 1,6-mannosyltransferase
MRVALIAESFLPQTNGVVHSVLRVLEHLQARGDQAMVIAPADPAGVPMIISGAPVITVPSLPLPIYPEVRIAGGPAAPVASLLRDFAPDVVHLASPFVLGWRGVLAAQSVGLPTVAVYQTDVPGLAVRSGFRLGERLLWRRVRDLHSRSTLTLAPSSASVTALESEGVERIRLWRRGVDSRRFRPGRRDHELRRRLAPNGEKLIGFVGRLAAEKQLDDLAVLRDLPDCRLVIIGDGPERRRLSTVLPEAIFTGMLHGDDLARTVASLDVVVTPGESETFCQVVQEAMASGVPVVAPAAGGPLDLIDHSRTGWLYPPGELMIMRDRVRDLIGDDAKREAFGRAARAAVLHRGWHPVCTELVGYYAEAADLHAAAAHGR